MKCSHCCARGRAHSETGLFNQALNLAVGCVLLCLPAGHIDAADALKLAWQTNVLTVSDDKLPGGTLNVWWLEAFCRRGSTKRPWNETTIPHKTELVSADPKGQRLRLSARSGAILGCLLRFHPIRSARYYAGGVFAARKLPPLRGQCPDAPPRVSADKSPA